MSAEKVVLLDSGGNAIGTVLKSAVHHADTPLHLAFSAYLFTTGGELLVTKRALHKLTFPGMWTNSVCGHPSPGEDLAEAVRRRAASELGLEVHGLRLVLPDFAYRAEMVGVVENELCPVFAGWVDGSGMPRFDPQEVASTEWVPWPTFAGDVLDGRRTVSHWCREQVTELAALGPHPTHWPAGDQALLPPAARLG